MKVKRGLLFCTCTPVKEGTGISINRTTTLSKNNKRLLFFFQTPLHVYRLLLIPVNYPQNPSPHMQKWYALSKWSPLQGFEPIPLCHKPYRKNTAFSLWSCYFLLLTREVFINEYRITYNSLLKIWTIQSSRCYLQW